MLSNVLLVDDYRLRIFSLLIISTKIGSRGPGFESHSGSVGRVSALLRVGCGFDPRPSHTNVFKNDTALLLGAQH